MVDDFRLVPEQDGGVSLALVRQQRVELLTLLDRATDGWITFMDRVGQYLGPVASKAGRPTKKEVEATMLGVLGFESWRAMIEAPREQGGLGWNFSTYQQWRKAYSVLKQVYGLREQQLTPAEVNRFATTIKKGNDNKLPENVEQWNELLLNEQAKQEQIKSAQETALKQQVQELTRELRAARETLAKGEVALEAEKRLTASQEATIAELRSQVRATLESVAGFNTTLAEKDAEIRRLGIKSADLSKQLNAAGAVAAELKQEKAEGLKLKKQIQELRSASLLERVFGWNALSKKSKGSKSE